MAAPLLSISTVDMDNKVCRALQFATTCHAGQFRRGRDRLPYICHPIAVKTKLEEFGITDTNVLAAALLHDTVEDCGVTKRMLALLFGSVVADVVAELTDPDVSRAERHSHQAKKIPHIQLVSVMIKMADRIHNLECMTYETDFRLTRMQTLRMTQYVGYSQQLSEAIQSRLKYDAPDLKLEPARQLLGALNKSILTLSDRLSSVFTTGI